MIDLVQFDFSPMATGEVRTLIVDGDGPFEITLSCFVSEPAPTSYRTCDECRVDTIEARRPYTFRAPLAFRDRWKGHLELTIRDLFGAAKVLRVDVFPDLVPIRPPTGGAA